MVTGGHHDPLRSARRVGSAGWRLVLPAVLWIGAWSLLVATTCPPPPPGACPAGPLSFYQGQVVDDGGNAIVGAHVAVAPSSAPAGVASLYADALKQSSTANPVVTDQFGRYHFYVSPGSYNLTITYGSVVRTLVNVGIVDPRKAHTTQGSNFEPPVTLSESSTAFDHGNAALILERLDASGQRLYGPWFFHVNTGATGDRADLQWVYNVDVDETQQASTLYATNDVALRMHLTPLGAVNPYNNNQPFAFAYDYAPPPTNATSVPQWTTLFAQDEATIPGIATLSITRVNGTGQRPFVVGDGLQGSLLRARRNGWICYNTTAPAGVLARLDHVPVVSCPFGGQNSVCECANLPGCDASHPCPGDVVVPTLVTDQFGNQLPGATWSTQAAQRDASVYLKIGNGTWPSTLSVGKALVKIATGATIAANDVIVSSGTQAGRATRDNTVTDPRRVIGFALESAGATLPGYVAIVRVSR